jgi:hypothetical protein
MGESAHSSGHTVTRPLLGFVASASCDYSSFCLPPSAFRPPPSSFLLPGVLAAPPPGRSAGSWPARRAAGVASSFRLPPSASPADRVLSVCPASWIRLSQRPCELDLGIALSWCRTRRWESRPTHPAIPPPGRSSGSAALRSRKTLYKVAHIPPPTTHPCSCRLNSERHRVAQWRPVWIVRLRRELPSRLAFGQYAWQKAQVTTGAAAANEGRSFLERTLIELVALGRFGPGLRLSEKNTTSPASQP